jgi:hypothetical protein
MTGPTKPRPQVAGLSEDVLRFIASSFRSVWALELLLLLRREPRLWEQDELVTAMRASELVVTNALDALVAAGLASVEGSGVRYAPVNDHVAGFVERVEVIYAVRPDAVRRAIIASTSSGASAFSDAFRLRRY